MKTILVLIILLAAGGTIAIFFWYLPARRTRLMIETQVQVGNGLRSIVNAQAEFRLNDRDANGINDFWTADVTGFYRAGLIPREIAEADADPVTPLCPKPVPYSGYYYIALKSDDSVTPPESYRQDTDQKSGKVHHLTKFAFLAYPAEPGNFAPYYYMVNENNSVFRARFSAPFPKNWPTDNELKNHWSKPD